MSHRVSCHICGNIRKAILRCAACVQVYCYKCQSKAVKHHGEDAFENGCISCKKLCCCYNKKAGYTSCSFQFYHCYKKCVFYKNKFQPRGYAKKKPNDKSNNNNNDNNNTNDDKKKSNSNENDMIGLFIDSDSSDEEIVKFSARASDLAKKEYPTNCSIDEEYNYISSDWFETNSFDAPLKSTGSSVIDDVNASEILDYEYGDYAHQDAILKVMDSNASDFSYSSMA